MFHPNPFPFGEARSSESSFGTSIWLSDYFFYWIFLVNLVLFHYLIISPIFSSRVTLFPAAFSTEYTSKMVKSTQFLSRTLFVCIPHLLTEQFPSAEIFGSPASTPLFDIRVAESLVSNTPFWTNNQFETTL